MTPAQFTQALASTRLDPAGLATQAARLVLVDGLSRNAAARKVGCDPAAVTRAVQRIPHTPMCPHCRQPMP